MMNPDTNDDTAVDHERCETGLLAEAQDAARVATADIDEETAHYLVSDLLDGGVVTPVPDDRMLVHEPSGNAFDSITQLAVFHQGWTTARDADEEDF